MERHRRGQRSEENVLETLILVFEVIVQPLKHTHLKLEFFPRFSSLWNNNFYNGLGWVVPVRKKSCIVITHLVRKFVPEICHTKLILVILVNIGQVQKTNPSKVRFIQ